MLSYHCRSGCVYRYTYQVPAVPIIIISILGKHNAEHKHTHVATYTHHRHVCRLLLKPKTRWDNRRIQQISFALRKSVEVYMACACMPFRGVAYFLWQLQTIHYYTSTDFLNATEVRCIGATKTRERTDVYKVLA